MLPLPQEASRQHSASIVVSVTYEEGVSSPSTSASSVALGSSVTINTNRLSSSATHTLTYTFGWGALNGFKVWIDEIDGDPGLINGPEQTVAGNPLG